MTDDPYRAPESEPPDLAADVLAEQALRLFDASEADRAAVAEALETTAKTLAGGAEITNEHRQQAAEQLKGAPFRLAGLEAKPESELSAEELNEKIGREAEAAGVLTREQIRGSQHKGASGFPSNWSTH